MPKKNQETEYTEETTSRFVQTEKWRLHYNEAGEGHPLIMLHGIGPGATGWSNFNQNLKGLAEDFRVILLDFPGWGKSDTIIASDKSRNAINCEAVELLMNALEIDTAALVGNSMGGAAVLEAMLAYPDRISHAVTMGSGIWKLPKIFAPEGYSEGIRIIWETYADPSPDNFRRLVEIMVYDSSFVSDELINQRSEAALANQVHLDNCIESPVGYEEGGPYAGVYEMLDKLSCSQVPTLMIHGRDDRVVPMEYTLQASALIKNSRAVILNQCGHWAQLEHAAEFNQLVRGFLASSR